MKRKNAYNEKGFQEYFEKQKDICIEKRMVDEDIQNMDKIRFCLSCDKTYWVITIDSDKSILLTDLNHKEYII